MTPELREAVLDLEKEAVREFLSAFGLRYDADIDYTVCLIAEGRIVATASASGDIIKAVAVSPDWRGENLTGRLAVSYTHLTVFKRARGRQNARRGVRDQ